MVQEGVIYAVEPPCSVINDPIKINFENFEGGFTIYSIQITVRHRGKMEI